MDNQPHTPEKKDIPIPTQIRSCGPSIASKISTGSQTVKASALTRRGHAPSPAKALQPNGDAVREAQTSEWHSRKPLKCTLRQVGPHLEEEITDCTHRS